MRRLSNGNNPHDVLGAWRPALSLISLRTTLIQAARTVTGIRVNSLGLFRRAVGGKIGIEVGGPSRSFTGRGMLPVYPYVSRVDNCVYASETFWEGEVKEGWTFRYHDGKPCGFNFIREATDLRGIGDASYDFLLSCHSLEHTANPVKALKEWRRVTKSDGTFVIVLPHYKYTFDRRRPPTPVNHMLDDYERGTGENDQTHIPEILALHDLSLHPEPITHEQLRAGILNNSAARFAHHHVFDEGNSSQLLEACGLAVAKVQLVKPYHIVLLAANSPSYLR
jgi:SAM-dependent methyltransferase